MNLKRLCISPKATLLEALPIMDSGVCQLALVVEDGRLCGVLADGDVRRALIQGKDLQTPVAEAMNKNPLTVRLSEGPGIALVRLREKRVRHIAVLNDGGNLCDLWSLEDLLNFTVLPNHVVIMAGGLGSRLAPLTDDTPKPMLPVGGQPLLEVTLETLRRQGFRQFYIAVNYRPECIMDYFGDGSRLGVSIHYVQEKKRMGTAGALGLLPPVALPFIVMNGDILTQLNFANVLKKHEERGTLGTMVIKRHDVQIPYGVVRYDEDHYMESIEEKPQHFFAVSAGINVLSPAALAYIPNDTFYDMPDLFSELLRRGGRPAIHEMTEYWMDIGRISDYRRVNEEFAQYW